MNKEEDIYNNKNYIVLGVDNWQIKSENHFSSLIAADHTIGYINNPIGLTDLIHEANTFLGDENERRRPLFCDTHFSSDEFKEEFNKLKKQRRIKAVRLVVPDFSKNKKSFYGIVPFSLNTASLYLDYYLNQMF